MEWKGKERKGKLDERQRGIGDERGSESVG